MSDEQYQSQRIPPQCVAHSGLEARVQVLERNYDALCKKVDAATRWILVAAGGVIIQLILQLTTMTTSNSGG